jgi:hypothetical protein
MKAIYAVPTPAVLPDWGNFLYLLRVDTKSRSWKVCRGCGSEILSKLRQHTREFCDGPTGVCAAKFEAAKKKTRHATRSHRLSEKTTNTSGNRSVHTPKL